MERVTLVRGGGRTADDDPIPGSEVDLWATAITPGSSTANKDRGRDRAPVVYTVYLWPAADLVEGDRLRVRGDLMDIAVRDWVSPYTGRRGQEILCTKGKG